MQKHPDEIKHLGVAYLLLSMAFTYQRATSLEGRVGKGISAQASHRTVREALTSYGSYYTIKRV